MKGKRYTHLTFKVHLENENSIDVSAFLAEMEAEDVHPNRASYQHLVGLYCMNGDIDKGGLWSSKQLFCDRKLVWFSYKIIRIILHLQKAIMIFFEYLNLTESREVEILFRYTKQNQFGGAHQVHQFWI